MATIYVFANLNNCQWFWTQFFYAVLVLGITADYCDNQCYFLVLWLNTPWITILIFVFLIFLLWVNSHSAKQCSVEVLIVSWAKTGLGIIALKDGPTLLW